MSAASISNKIERHIYDARDDLAKALALAVAGILAGAVAVRGNAVLAVSGGSTPKQFFAALSQCAIDWSQVTIILVDERIVPADHDRANAKLVRENLLVNEAAAATLLPYAVDGETPEACAAASAHLLVTLTDQIDALILGMGTDGHTASFFPGGDKLDVALDMNGTATVLPMRAEGAGEPRLTLTLPVIMRAHFLALHIEGAEKMQVLEAAMQGGDENEMPVRAVLKNESANAINLFWAP